MLNYIDEIEPGKLEGKIVIVRVDISVPIVDGQISNPSQIDRIVETVDFLRANRAKTILLSHAEDSGDGSLLPVCQYLNGYFPVEFSPTYFTPEAVDKIIQMEEKSVLLFENIRNNPGEKACDPEFAKKLAQMGDIYVNDAFAVSHRKHASIVELPKLMPRYGGLLLRQEIEHLSKVFNPEHPFVMIIGGAKFETKLPLIKKYLEKADSVFVGGALSNDVYKSKGWEVGKSLVSDGNFDISQIASNPKLYVPTDVTVCQDSSLTTPGISKKADMIGEEEVVVDAGVETLDHLKEMLANAKTIVWNGPLGNYEKGFGEKTEKLAEIVAQATAQGATSIVGGGDTLSVISKLDLNDKFSFISTGGGAMMDFLVNETLPGIEALQK